MIIQGLGNVGEDYELIAKKELELTMTNSNNTVNEIIQAGNQGTEVIGVADRAGPTSRNHSWQRYQDRVFI